MCPIDAEERKQLLKSCENLLRVRSQYAQLVLVFCDERVGRQDIAVSAEQLQAMIDEIIKMAKQYLSTGEGSGFVQNKLVEASARAEALFEIMRQHCESREIPMGIHPDDWIWMEKL
jgi:sugar diacid utilization regulator